MKAAATAPVTTEREKISPIFQFSLILISAAIICSVFYLRMGYFRSLDAPMVFQNFTPQKLLEFRGFPKTINVGLHVDNFQTFDVKNNQFIFIGSVWFEFEGDAISVETLSNFNFDRATILYKSEPDIKMMGSRMMVRYLVKVSFNSGLVYKDFPVDSHRINLVLTHPFVTPGEAIFENQADDFVFTGDLSSFGWRTRGLFVKQGYSAAQLSEQAGDKIVYQPLVGFAIDVIPYGARSLIAIMLPLLLICFLMYFSLSVDTNVSMTVALGGITGILAYRYVIEQLSPKTADLMISDYLFFLVLTAAMLIFFLNQIDLFVVRLNQTKKKLGITVIHFFTVSVTIFLLLP